MRHIKKSDPPEELLTWIEAQKGIGVNQKYPPDQAAKVAIRSRLMIEQGGLCAYTGIAIREVQGVKDFHIEHIKPQSECAPGEDVCWQNLVGAVNKAADLEYGATVKADWWDPDLFVSPLSEGCERRFSYEQNGQISAASNEDPAATETIEVLNLCDEELRKLRGAAIDGFVFEDGSPNSLTEILALLDTSPKAPVEFDFAIRSVINKLISG